QISSCPVVPLRQRRSTKPSPLKSRCPTIAQGLGAEPGDPPPTTLVPFASQVTTCPLVVLYQTMAVRQSPLKSWVPVGGATNTQAAPAVLLSPFPPTMAVLQDSATEKPCWAAPTAPVPNSLFPCWVHTPPLRVNTHAAPTPLLSKNPPTMAVLPPPDSATEEPCAAVPPAPVPTSLLPCCVHPPPLRVNTHAVPALLLSSGPPTIAVLPSADSATDQPCSVVRAASGGNGLTPC